MQKQFRSGWNVLRPKAWNAKLHQISMFCWQSARKCLWLFKGRDTPSRLQRTSGNESRRCCRLASAALDQKAAREHTAQTTADGKLTCAFCACVRGINCLFQQLSIVYIRHSKGETETKIYKINADIRNIKKAVLAYHFEISTVDNFNHFKRLMLLWKHSHIRMIGKDHVTFKQPSVCSAFIYVLVFITFAVILGHWLVC